MTSLPSPNVSLRPRAPWERWALLLLALILLSLAAPWGLPSRARVELLTLGHALAPQERARMVAVRREKNEEREAWRLDNAAKAAKGKHVGIFRNDYDAGLILTEDQKLFALGSYLLNGAAHDEAQTYHALASMRPSRLDFDPHFFVYGGAYLYPLGAILAVMKGLGLIHVGDAAFYLDHPDQIARLYLAGRAMNVAAFLGLLWLIGRVAERLARRMALGRGGARLAAAVAMGAWLCSTLAIDQALVSKPHLYAAFWAFLAVDLLLACDAPSPRSLAAAGALAGWAMGASFVNFLMFVPLAFLALPPVPAARDAADGKAWARRAVIRLMILGAPMALAFAAINPYVFLRFNAFRATFAGHGDSGFRAISLHKLAIFCEELFTRDYAFPVALVGGLELIRAALDRRSCRRLAWGALAMIAVAGSTVAIARIALFAGPFICVGAGLAFGRLWSLTRRSRSASACVAGATALACGLMTFGAALSYRDAIFDQAWLAPTRQWVAAARLAPAPAPSTPGPKSRMETNSLSVPEPSIGVYGSGQPHPANLPPLPFLGTRVLNMNKWTPGAPEPDFVLVSRDDAKLWAACPLSMRYRETANLGDRRSYDWLRALRFPSQSQVSARVFARP